MSSNRWPDGRRTGAWAHGATAVVRIACLAICAIGVGFSACETQRTDSGDEGRDVLTAAVDLVRRHVQSRAMELRELAPSAEAARRLNPAPDVVLIAGRPYVPEGVDMPPGLSEPRVEQLARYVGAKGVVDQVDVDVEPRRDYLFLKLTEPKIRADTADVALGYTFYLGADWPHMVSATVRFVRDRDGTWRPTPLRHCFHSAGAGCPSPEHAQAQPS